MNNWDKIEYQKITSAKIRENILIVKFDNGDIIELPVTTLLPPESYNIDQESMIVSEYDICLKALPEDVRIPWDRIRVLTDSDFAKDMVTYKIYVTDECNIIYHIKLIIKIFATNLGTLKLQKLQF